MPHHVRKAEAEKVIRARLGRATVLRPAAYAQNVLDAALGGRIAVPYSVDAPFTNVDLADVGEVAALVLTGAGHEGATYDTCHNRPTAEPEVSAVHEATRAVARRRELVYFGHFWKC